MLAGKVNIVIDGAWGSTGKGKLVGILARKHKPELAVCNFMTNAGHTWVPDNGTAPVMVQQLPTSLINPTTQLHIAASAAIDLKVWNGELDQFDVPYGVRHRLSVDPRAMVITKEDKEAEAASLHRISSTVKGCGAAVASKVMRKASLVQDYPNEFHKIIDTEKVVHVAIGAKWKVLFETAQGFDLSLNHGTRYPYCTSRDITVAQALNDACVPPKAVGHVYASLRANPIRVGNAYEFTKSTGADGWSGPFYPDQRELSWEEVTGLAGSDRALLERTTVTNKVRRIFTFSHQQLDRFIKVNAPDFLFINFVNYIDARCFGYNVVPEDVSAFMRLFPRVEAFVKSVEEHGVPVAYLGTGPKHGHLVDFGIDPV
jgi:adenylosuccinate synthase